MIIIGWIGGLILAISSLPQLLKTISDGHAEGLSTVFLLAWLIGEVLSLIYVTPTHNWPLIANYSANLFIVALIGYYKVWPRSSRNLIHREPLTRDQRSAIFNKGGGEVG